MTELWVHESGRQVDAAQIWPSSGPLPQGFLCENREFIFELRGVTEPDSIDLFIDDLPATPLRCGPGTARWSWFPGFYAGSIEVRLERTRIPFLQTNLTIDPDKAKLTREDFDLMVTQILEDTLALVSLSGFRFGIGRGVGGEVPPIARLEFLRSRLDEIVAVIHEICEQPVRILSAIEEVVPQHCLRRATRAELVRSFNRGGLTPLPAHLPFAQRMQSLFPRKIIRNRKTVGLDIGEHRAIKSALVSWRSWLQATAGILDVAQSQDRNIDQARRHWADRCRSLARRIGSLLELPFFSEISDQHHPVTLTSVFRWVARYRRFFLLYRDINLGIANVQGDFLQMPLARTHDLYELWAFLRILRAAIKLFSLKGIDISTLFKVQSRSRAVTVGAENVEIPLTSKWALCFKRSFREYWLCSPPGQPGSFSRPMIPDVSLIAPPASEGAGNVIVLDAKYRIEMQLNEAIASLHMYRDAIVRDPGDEQPERAVIGAYVITPHVPGKETERGVGPWKDEKMPALLFHPRYRSTFKFGALTLRPGMTDEQVLTALEMICRDAGVTPKPESAGHPETQNG